MRVFTPPPSPETSGSFPKAAAGSFGKFYAGKRVLVTGAAGFIGGALCHRLKALGAFVVGLDLNDPAPIGSVNSPNPTSNEWHKLDCSDLQLVEKATAGCEVIFALAGRCGHSDSMNDPLGDMRSNVLAPLALLEACRRTAPKAHFIYSSTRQVYGRQRKLPVDERSRVAPVDINGVHKAASELHCLLYHQHHSLCTTVLRLTNTYGPGMACQKEGGMFLGQWIYRALYGRSIPIYGDGTQLRDFSHINDVISAFLQSGCVGRRVAGEVLNIGAPQAISLKELAQLLSHVSGGCSKIKFEPFPLHLRAIDIGSYHGSIAKARRLLGWIPTMSLEAGLKETFDSVKRQRLHLQWGQ